MKLIVSTTKVSLKQFARVLVSWLARIYSPRQTRRKLILSTPFPQSWNEFFKAWSGHYRRLPAAYRDQFKQQTQIFLAEKRITGVEIEVTEEMRLLVAASAVILTSWAGRATPGIN
jgi:Mlc titration factor MtfA (ptsG expression regulator)